MTQTPPIPQIISASRRTDIPAFHTDWLLAAVRQGYARVPNPYTQREYEVSLQPIDVAAIVFWSRDYRPLLPHLDELDQRFGKRLVFHFTCTAFQPSARRILEPALPPYEKRLSSLKQLAERYGRDHIFWRFDPILFSNLSPPSERLATFRKLLPQMQQCTHRCFISFVDLYRKVRRHLQPLQQSGRLQLETPTLAERIEFAWQLAGEARSYGIEVLSCCEEDIAAARAVPTGHCIDAPYLKRLFPEVDIPVQLYPSRKGCGCYRSRDIGRYGSCRHACLYCYAN